MIIASSVGEVEVFAGVDSHTDTHHAAALDARGGVLGSRTFPVTKEGYAELLSWLESFGSITAIGVESTGAYAAGLVRYLRNHDVVVLEVNQPHPHARRRRGKSDRIDAELAARRALSREGIAIPKSEDRPASAH